MARTKRAPLRPYGWVQDLALWGIWFASLAPRRTQQLFRKVMTYSLLNLVETTTTITTTITTSYLTHYFRITAFHHHFSYVSDLNYELVVGI